MVVAEETFAGPFVENLEDLEAKVVKRIIKSFVELPEVLKKLEKFFVKVLKQEPEELEKLIEELLIILLKKLE